ncbi:MAG: DNA polymerase III subunit gamma/tau [Candidatus Omnitrophota bacterium]
MSYQTLAQKYRPCDFSEIVGQDSATRTLINSIEKKRVANAYMFAGPRGTGKTSMARLLSKTLNCERAEAGKPCNKCDTCREISQGNSIDVLEIDGASNRGIDEIRALRENVKFSPSRSKYKIYIIDEVHMLTTEAFNALLKTLEEPPAHVKFIFATTEPHKVLPTIMSRCQRFDFRKIPPMDIYGKVKDIASREGIDIADSAALILARSADGSLRDALVVLDQMVSFSSGKIESKDVIDLLGMVQRDKIFELAGSIIEKDAGKAVRISDELIAGGKDPVFLNSSLISHFRDIMVVKTIGEASSDMAMSDEETKVIMEQKEGISLEEILYVLQNLTHCASLMKNSMFSRAPFEVTLIRLAKRASAMKLTDIVSRLEALEGKGELNSGPERVSRGGGQAIGREASPVKTSPGTDEISQKASFPRQALPVEPDAGTQDEDEEMGGEVLPNPAGFDDQKNRWKSLLNHIRTRKMSVFVFLNSAHLLEMKADSLAVGFDKENIFNKEALETGPNRSVLQEAADKLMGRPVRISFSILENESGQEKNRLELEQKKVIEKEKMKPAIEKALDIFGGHVVRDISDGV